MKKMILTLAATILVATTMAPTAEAGGCGKGFRSFSHSQSYSSSYHARKKAIAAAKRRAKARRIAAAKRAAIKARLAAKKKLQAKRRLAARLARQRRIAAAHKVADQHKEPGKEVATVNAPATSETVAAAAEGETTRMAAREIGCKRYIPSAGMTISVACE